MSKVSLKIEGLDKLIWTKLVGDTLYAEPMRHVVETITEVVAGKAEERAPKRTYRLAGSIQTEIDSRPLPTWGKVTATASSSSVRYPFVLEAGRRAPSGLGRAATKRRKPLQDTSRYILLHYRGTRRSTRGWFSGSMRGMKQRARQLLDWAAREVERSWAR